MSINISEAKKPLFLKIENEFCKISYTLLCQFQLSSYLLKIILFSFFV